ncbi:hypothetical protein [Streptomyces sp. N1]|uniref:hypothetical protein n=1 Tax=Streptomyces sp. N1 TaxID=576456 RepID=UPI00101218FD|nr:hypothetical protein [Streptomyces sp. N1]
MLVLEDEFAGEACPVAEVSSADGVVAPDEVVGAHAGPLGVEPGHEFAYLVVGEGFVALPVLEAGGEPGDVAQASAAVLVADEGEVGLAQVPQGGEGGEDDVAEVVYLVDEQDEGLVRVVSWMWFSRERPATLSGWARR